MVRRGCARRQIVDRTVVALAPEERKKLLDFAAIPIANQLGVDLKAFARLLVDESRQP